VQKSKACPGARRATRCRRPGIFYAVTVHPLFTLVLIHFTQSSTFYKSKNFHAKTPSRKGAAKKKLCVISCASGVQKLSARFPKLRLSAPTNPRANLFSTK